MIIEPIFSNFLASEDLNIDHYQIAEWCKQAQPTQRDSTRIDLTLMEPSLQELFDIIYDKLNEVHTEIGLSPMHKQIIEESWVNIGEDIRTFSPHCHPSFTLTAVYYPRVPKGSGSLILRNPISAMEHVFTNHPHEQMVTEHTMYSSVLYNLQPREGELVIFPSWLEHYVTPNTEPCERISIAINSKARIFSDDWL